MGNRCGLLKFVLLPLSFVTGMDMSWPNVGNAFSSSRTNGTGSGMGSCSAGKIVGSCFILFFCCLERFCCCFVGMNSSSFLLLGFSFCWFFDSSLLVNDCERCRSVREVDWKTLSDGLDFDCVEDFLVFEEIFLFDEEFWSDRWDWDGFEECGDMEWGRGVETTLFQDGVDLKDYFNE